MKKHLLILSVIAIFLSGCASIYNSLGGYVYPEMQQLKGKHISEVQKRIDSFAKVEIGTLSNEYYLQAIPRKVVNYTTRCNFYGCYNTDFVYNQWGYAYLVTDKQGFITKYVENGDYFYDYRKYFKDLIVLEK